MSKVKEEYKKQAEKVNSPDNKEVLENLKSQLEQHQKQALYHKEMALKALGAIEVLTQLVEKDIPEGGNIGV